MWLLWEQEGDPKTCAKCSELCKMCYVWMKVNANRNSSITSWKDTSRPTRLQQRVTEKYVRMAGYGPTGVSRQVYKIISNMVKATAPHPNAKSCVEYLFQLLTPACLSILVAETKRRYLNIYLQIMSARPLRILQV